MIARLSAWPDSDIPHEKRLEFLKEVEDFR